MTDTNGIGERLKTLRNDRGLTLVELGEKVDLSPSYLSQVERDRTTPSLSTLATLAKIFNVELRYFFESESQAIHVVLANQWQAVESQVLEQVAPEARQALMPPAGNPKIEIVRITASAVTVSEPLEHFNGEEAIYVLTGELVVIVGEEQFELEAGDSIHYDALQPHRWQNRSAEPCSFIWSRAQSISDQQS